MPANLNLHTYRLLNGTLVSPIGFTNQSLPDCSTGYNVTDILYNTLTNTIVLAFGANVVSALKVLNTCTNDYTVVQGNRTSIQTYLDDNCCPQYDACITFTSIAPGFEVCTNGEFNYPLLADLTAYGGSVDVVIDSDADLIATLFALIGYNVFVSECHICFPTNYGGVIVDIPVKVLESPSTTIELNPLDPYEVQWADVHGSSNGVACGSWVSQTNTFDIGGALLSVANVTPIQLCDYDISGLAGSLNYSGLMTATRTVVDCGGSYTDTDTFFITTDSNGLIKNINSNYCYVPKSTPTSPSITVNVTTGIAQVNIDNEYQYQGIGAYVPIVTDECAELKLYNTATNTLVGHVKGSTLTDVDSWVDVLGNITAHVATAQTVDSFDFDFISFCEDNSIFVDPLTKDITLKFVTYVGGSCLAVASPTIIVQSYNVDNFTELVFSCANYNVSLSVTSTNFDDAYFNGQTTTSYTITQVASDGCNDRIERSITASTTMVGTKIYDWVVNSINAVYTDINDLGAFNAVNPLVVDLCTNIEDDYTNNTSGEKGTLTTLLIRNTVGCETYCYIGIANSTTATACGWDTGSQDYTGGSACTSPAYNALTSGTPFAAFFASKTNTGKEKLWVSGNIQNLYSLATSIVWEIKVNGNPVVTQNGGYTFAHYSTNFATTHGMIIGDQIEYKVEAIVEGITYSHSSTACAALDTDLEKTT